MSFLFESCQKKTQCHNKSLKRCFAISFKPFINPFGMYLLKNAVDKFAMSNGIARVVVHLFIALFLFFSACGNNQKTPQEYRNPDSLDNAVNTHVLGNILTDYLALSEALSKDNSELAAEESKKLFQAAKLLSVTKNKPGNDSIWKVILPEIIEDAEHIEKNSEDIGHQRMHFTALSADLIELINEMGTPITLYQIHCPMFDKSSGGADWLAKSKKFQNPFLGSKMESCGDVRKSIHPK